MLAANTHKRQPVWLLGAILWHRVKTVTAASMNRDLRKSQAERERETGECSKRHRHEDRPSSAETDIEELSCIEAEFLQHALRRISDTIA